MLLKNQKLNVISGCSYHNFPELYDLFYKRYLRTVPIFVNLVKKNISHDDKILDLAAGTGEVSIPLLKHGYQVISFDLNLGMLKQLKKKAVSNKIKNCHIVCGDINKLNFSSQFDAVVIRQAINYYLGPNKLINGFRKIYRSLKKGGIFIFNAPNYQIRTIKYPIVSNFYQNKKQSAFVVETNQLKGRLLIHQQHALLWRDKSYQIQHFFDQNIFYMFTKKEFKRALYRAGFSEISFYSSQLKSCRSEDKALYCVAKKYETSRQNLV